MDLLSDCLFYYILFNLTYYLSGGFLFVIDYKQLLTQYKLQHVEYENMMAIYRRIIPNVLMNTFVYSIPAILIIVLSINRLDLEFNVIRCIADIIYSALMSDLIFFITHKILHNKNFYHLYHKLHHEVNAPVGLSAAYLTPMDFYSNIVSIYLPPILLSCHQITVVIWVILSTMNTVMVAHGGFSFVSSFHDKHHEVFNCNYGIGLWVDKLFGTEYIPSNFNPESESETLSETFNS